MTPSNQYRTISDCRVCHSKNLISILSLGNQFVSNFVEHMDTNNTHAPLEIVLCDAQKGGCGLLQLAHTVSPPEMYEQYWYRSGINQSMRTALADIASVIKHKVNLTKGDVILDIGCNDGTLLRSYGVEGAQLIGFDPAKNMRPFAIEGTTKIFTDFFKADTYFSALGTQKAKTVTTIAMFYDLDDPNTFVGDIKKVLSDDGIWVIQMNYLPFMLQDNVFDNICHEHLEYYSMKSLEALLQRHQFKIVDVTTNEINGGSYRIFVAHDSSASKFENPESRQRIEKLHALENKMKLSDASAYFDFAQRVTKIRENCVSFIRKEVAAGKKIFLYGASTKGNVILQYFGLDHTIIPAAAERNPDKYGKKTVGTLIPIISEADARAQKPDYFFVMPWFFMKEFFVRETEFVNGGGKFIVPVPEFRVIGKGDTVHVPMHQL